MRGAMLCVVVAAAACGERYTREADQCLRREIFKECMAALPKGPERLAAAGNDWDEVVTECASVAYFQSLRQVANIKKECRP